MDYPIYDREEAVGIAWVMKEGLYYRIQCQLRGSAPCRITAKAEHQIELGLCIPGGDTAGLEVRIPMKKLGEGNPSFFVESQNENRQGEWFPISPEEPFPYIAKLKTSYLVSRDGKVGIAFKETDQFPNRRDNDRNP